MRRGPVEGTRSSPDDNIPVLIDNHSAGGVLAEEGVRDEVEEDVAEKTTGRERDHGVEAAGLEVGGDGEENEVGHGGDVEGGEDWGERERGRACRVARRETRLGYWGATTCGRSTSSHLRGRVM